MNSQTAFSTWHFLVYVTLEVLTLTVSTVEVTILFGIKEQLIFPEVEYDKIDKVRGMDIIFVTTANTDEEARELLTLFNMPFAK